MYIFGSRDVTNGFLPNGERDFCSTDYHVIYSDDLIHWTDAGVSISIDSIPAEIRGNTRRLWAPDVFKKPDRKRQVLPAVLRQRPAGVYRRGDEPDRAFRQRPARNAERRAHPADRSGRTGRR